MKLNGWHRLGIIASVFWMLIGGCYGNSVGLHQGDIAFDAYERCVSYGLEFSRCSAELDSNYAALTADHWLVAAFYAFVPIILAWLFVWIIIRLSRWVRRGFQLASQ